MIDIKYMIDPLKIAMEEYKNKKVGKEYVVRNNLYPKKKNREIFIFVGKSLTITVNLVGVE